MEIRQLNVRKCLMRKVKKSLSSSTDGHQFFFFEFMSALLFLYQHLDKILTTKTTYKGASKSLKDRLHCKLKRNENFKTLPQVSETTARATVAYLFVETLQCFSSL